MIIIGLAVVVFIVFMSNAERRIPVQYAKRVVGRKMYGGQSTHLPIKVNASGVMPIIFASSILSLPQTIAMFWQPETGTVGYHIMNLFSQTNPFYIVVISCLSSRLRISTHPFSLNPIEIANTLKKNGGFIPGFRPGKPTSDFITKALGEGHLRWCHLPEHCRDPAADRWRDQHDPVQRGAWRHLGHHCCRRCA